MRIFILMILAAMAASFLSGCSSTTDALELAGTDPRVTGIYPNFSVTPTAATEQMSDSEARAMGAELQALADARQAGDMSEAEYQLRLKRLRELARTHDDLAAQEIEN